MDQRMEHEAGREIGSIFELDPGLLQGREGGSAFPDSLTEIMKFAGDKEYSAFTASGREAILLCLKALSKAEPLLAKRCLMPAYMCDAVFLPFLSEGWELIFYSIGADLSADAEELEELVQKKKPGLFFYAPYYGRDTWEKLRPLIRTFQEQGIRCMEDVTQSYYLKNAGVSADFCIGSLRKWYAVLDGGFVLSSIPLLSGLSGNRERTMRRLSILTDKWSYLHCEADPKEKARQKERYLSGNLKLEEDLDKLEGIYAISEETGILLQQTEEEVCCKRRQENYRFLFRNLSGRQFLRHPFPDWVEDCAPLYFPVYAEYRDFLQQCLREEGIFAPVLWPIGEANESVLKTSDQELFTHLLALPMDQRYGEEDMRRMVAVIERYEREERNRRSRESAVKQKGRVL